MKTKSTLVGLALLLLASPAYSTISKFPVSGYLTDADGNAVSSDTEMTFTLYDGCDSDTALAATDPTVVSFSEGTFSATIDLDSLESAEQTAVSAATELCLGITVGSDTEMSPRIAYYTVPYARKAAVADLALACSAVSEGAVGEGLVVEEDGTINLALDSTLTWSGPNTYSGQALFSKNPENTTASAALLVSPASSDAGDIFFAVKDSTTDLFNINKAGTVAFGSTYTSCGALTTNGSGVMQCGSAGGIADDSVTSAKITDATIVNADISGSAAIAYGKLNLAGSIVTGDITDATIVNADISASAAIDFSKLATLTSGRILVGSAGGVATSVVMSGDAGLSNAGVLTIANDAVTTAKILDDNVTTDKIADNTITATDLSATLTFADGDLINLAAVNADSTTEGLILPQSTDVSAATAEGQISWDTDHDSLYVGTGAGIKAIVGELSEVQFVRTTYNTFLNPGQDSIVSVAATMGDNAKWGDIGSAIMVTATNSNTDAGDTLYGILINSLAGANDGGITEVALNIGNSWDYGISTESPIFLSNTNIVFDGSTADASTTTLTVVDPTVSRTITLPDASGTVMVSSVRTISDTNGGDAADHEETGLSSDRIVLCNPNLGDGNVYYNLPTAAGNAGLQITLKSIAGGQTCFIDAGAETIDGDANDIAIGPLNTFVTVVSDGANWWIISSNLP